MYGRIVRTAGLVVVALLGSLSLTVCEQPSSEKALTSFGIASPAVSGTIDEGTYAVAVTVPYGTSLSGLIAVFTTSGVQVKVGDAVQQSGTTPNDFSSPLTYTVLAADATTQDYMVTVAVADRLAGVDPTGATVSFWHNHAGTRGDVLASMIGDFNASNPWGIVVTGEYQGSYADIYSKMSAAIASHTAPELVVAYQNQAAVYQSSNALVDINTYLTHPTYGFTEEEYADFVEGFLSQDVSAQFDGMRLGFPPNRSIELMYYNQTWLDAIEIAAPPESWGEFYTACEAANDVTAGTYGYAVDTDASRVFSQVISRGGTVLAEDGRSYCFTGQAMKESMAYMRSLVVAGFARRISAVNADQSEFANSKALLTIGSTSGLPYYAAAVESSGSPFEWSIAPIPHTTATATLNLYGASVSISKSTDAKQLAAWLFVKWFAEPEQQATWVEASNYFPVRESVAPLLQDYMADNPRFAEAWSLLTTSTLKSEPPFSEYSDVRAAVTTAYNAILDGADIDTTLSALEAEANALVDP